jgi:hypothetical protein
MNFTIGLPVYSLIKGDRAIITQEIIHPLDEKYEGYTLAQLGIAISECEIQTSCGGKYD